MSPLLLIMDDDQNILDLYQLLLEKEGYRVHLSLIPFEDVRKVELLHPDLIVLDLKFGVQYTGYSLLQQLKMYPPTSAIPTILCTAALAEIQEQEAILRTKGIPVLYKPFALDELLAVIRFALSSQALKR